MLHTYKILFSISFLIFNSSWANANGTDVLVSEVNKQQEQSYKSSQLECFKGYYSNESYREIYNSANKSTETSLLEGQRWSPSMVYAADVWSWENSESAENELKELLLKDSKYSMESFKIDEVLASCYAGVPMPNGIHVIAVSEKSVCKLTRKIKAKNFIQSIFQSNEYESSFLCHPLLMQ